MSDQKNMINRLKDEPDGSFGENAVHEELYLEPEEFGKTLADSVDRRFISVLAASVIFHIAFVVYFLLNPLPQHTQVEKIQERLARTLKKLEAQAEENFFEFKIKETPKDIVEQNGDGTKKSETRKKAPKKPQKKQIAKNESKPRNRRGRRRSGGLSTQKIAKNVSTKGVLALLTSTSSTATGSLTADLLGNDSYSAGDLDKAIANISSLKSSSGHGGGRINQVRGSRDTGSAGIDDMVSGLGETDTQSFERKGDLVTASDKPVVENAGGSGMPGRNPDDVQEVIFRHNKSIQYCYERQLKRNPNLKGKVTVRFTIASSGRVTGVEILTSTLKNKSVERCIVNRIRRWNDFGAIDSSYGNTTIRQTYAFGY